jgi:hypothetical protein
VFNHVRENGKRGSQSALGSVSLSERRVTLGKAKG